VLRRDFIQLLDEDRAQVLQTFDHITIVHDLVPDIDRRAVFFNASTTIWMARSTPAQKPRGPHRRIVRGFFEADMNGSVSSGRTWGRQGWTVKGGARQALPFPRPDFIPSGCSPPLPGRIGKMAAVGSRSKLSNATFRPPPGVFDPIRSVSCRRSGVFGLLSLRQCAPATWARGAFTPGTTLDF
jgi:hypothetical protein